MNTENSKTNEPHKFRLSLSDKLNFNSPPLPPRPSKKTALGNLHMEKH